MTRQEFIDLLQRTHDEIVRLNMTKGVDYAGNEDALLNFKEAAQEVGTTPERIWHVYFHKHWSAIRSYISRGKVESEPIEGRIKDAILYLYLLLGLVEESRHTAPDVVESPTTRAEPASA